MTLQDPQTFERQGEFVSIINAMEVQIESARPDALAMTLLGDALRAVACARGINAERLHLPQQLKALLDRILVNTGM